MDFCPKCGMTLRPGAFVCPRCGAPIPYDAPAEGSALPLYAASPAAPEPPAAGPVSSPVGRPFYQVESEPPPAGALTTGGYLLCLLLFNIPIAGLIAALVFAFGGTPDRARRDLARAQLLLWLIIAGLAAVYFAVSAVLSAFSMF